MAISPLGVRLRQYRTRKGLSLQKLADAVGATKGHIWDLEQGNTQNPSLDLLTALSRALEVPIKDLVGETDQVTGPEEDAKLAPLFRDLRGLEPEQLDLIRTMTNKLREMRGGGDKTGGGPK